MLYNGMNLKDIPAPPPPNLPCLNSLGEILIASWKVNYGE